MKARAGLLSVALVSAGLALAPLTSASAVSALHTSIVSATPQVNTPDVLQNHVEEITKVGNKIILGGNFTTAKNHPANSPVLIRHHILAFDATTGLIDTNFVPDLTDPAYPEPTSQVQVNALLPGPAPDTVYVGGNFKLLNGDNVPRLILLDTNTGLRVPGFTPNFNGAVNDVKLDPIAAHNRLYVAGNFTTAGTPPAAHAGLATVNSTTGAIDTFMSVQTAGHHNWTTSSPAGDAKAAVGPFKLDVAPDGNRVVAIGNFKTVSDATHTNGDYDQVVLLDTSGATAVIADWQTNRYDERCFASAYDQWVRDVDFSPDGAYFVIVGTGGYPTTYSNICDAAARWETAATGAALNPTWVDWTGGDTLLSVAVTGAAVYVGGHQRFMNNKLVSDKAGPGAVPRPGLAALNPVNGMPLAWNPGRNPRGAGAYAMFASSDKVYVGSDTMYIGNRGLPKHQRIAAFPLAGGTAVAPDNTGTLPGTVHQGGRATTLYRVNAGGPALGATDGGPDWAGDPSPDAPQSVPLLRNPGSVVSTYTGTAARNAVLPASTPTALFNSERYDQAGGSEMAWTFPVPKGTQVKVRLYFANRYAGTGVIGRRIFNVNIDGGATELANYDIVRDTGNNTGTMKEFAITSDGTVNVDLTHGPIENPLINGIEIVASPPTGADDRTSRSFDGTTAGPPTSSTDPSILWSHARGAFMVDGNVYYGYDDGKMRKRSFDGTTFGDEVILDPYNDPFWSTVETGSAPAGSTYRGLASGLAAAMHNVTTMFYSKGRLYYTFSGRTELFSRYFQPDSGIIGSEEFIGDPGGINWSDVAGTFLDATNNKLYYAKRSGALWSVTWSPAPAVPTPGQPVGGKPVAGTQVQVTPNDVNGVPTEDWRGMGVFMRAS